MKLSVVIPTQNRADTLKITLEKLMTQEGVDFEVVVADDGSTDNTEITVSSLKSQARGVEIKYIKQAASHQGTARNRGVEAATGDIVVFIGDDIFVEPGFLKAHADRHAEHPEENVVVLGFSTWDPALQINDYMRFLESSGWQFGYSFLTPGFVNVAEPYKFFYTSNLSIKRSYFNQERFDESFRVYGWEDVELGYRFWRRHGMKLFYEPKAKAYHHHLTTENDLPRRMQAIGQSAVLFEALHPEVSLYPKGFKRWAIGWASQPWVLKILKAVHQSLYFKVRCWTEFMRGVRAK